MLIVLEASRWVAKSKSCCIGYIANKPQSHPPAWMCTFMKFRVISLASVCNKVAIWALTPMLTDRYILSYTLTTGWRVPIVETVSQWPWWLFTTCTNSPLSTSYEKTIPLITSCKPGTAGNAWDFYINGKSSLTIEHEFKRSKLRWIMTRGIVCENTCVQVATPVFTLVGHKLH